MMTIADRIRNRRLELGLSVDDLANRLQKNRATVYRYESSYIKSYSPDVMEALAKALETTPAYFYGYEEADAPADPAQPKNEKINNLVRILNELPPEESAQAVDMFTSMFKLMFPKKDVFEKGNENDANS